MTGLPSASWLAHVAVFAASVAGGAVNAVAAGGILLTFPALVAAGLDPLVATATSTLALWPANLSSVVGYRRELQGARGWAVRFAIPSVAGGAAGGYLLLRTPVRRFAQLVPFLVLGATLLFVLQPVLSRRTARRTAHPPSSTAGPGTANPPLGAPPLRFLALQLLVALYGGYFGAGAGIVMLASLGSMGLRNIHQMNGLKNWGALCFNLTAALLFIAAGRVDWPMAITVALGAVLGASGTAGIARRLPQRVVRSVILGAGVLSALWLFVSR